MYVKKLAEPIANRIIKKASEQEFFKRYICLPPANLYHFYEANIKFRVMNIGKIRMKSVPKMSEKDAIVLGANLFAEFCVYFFASGKLFWKLKKHFSEVLFAVFALNEVLKYKAREKEKDEQFEEETKELLDNVDRLDKILDNQICDIQHLESIVAVYKKELSS